MSEIDTIATGWLPPFPTSLGMQVVLAKPGHVQLRLKVRPDLVNGGGTAHGGVVASLIDTAVGFATSLLGGEGRRGAITLSLTVNYIGPIPVDGEMIAVATVRGGGRSSVFAECAVTDGTGALVATGVSVLRQRPPKPAQEITA